MPDIIIIAGEPSADMHGAALAKELKKMNPQLRISGIGSIQMQNAGVEIFADLTQYAVIGFLEVLKHFGEFKRIFNKTIEYIKKNSPQVIVLIDFPGFNLRLAKQIKKDSPQTKIIYYISPQIWAWGQKRIELIKKVVDKMIVVFEFEYKLYKQKGVDVEFVGHPLLERIPFLEKNESSEKGLHNADYNRTIALLPGSREIEVKRILPIMLKSARVFLRKMPKTNFIILKASNIKTELVRNLINKYNNLSIRIIDKHQYESLSQSCFAWVCSGTATLETAIITIPMLVIYKTSFLTWLISKCLIKLPYIGLVNIAAGEKVVPEFIQYQAVPKNIVQYTLAYFRSDNLKKVSLRQKLARIREKLGSSKANENAAKIILTLLKE